MIKKKHLIAATRITENKKRFEKFILPRIWKLFGQLYLIAFDLTNPVRSWAYAKKNDESISIIGSHLLQRINFLTFRLRDIS